MGPTDKRWSRKELESFLSSAPEGLRDWADEQLAKLDSEPSSGAAEQPAKANSSQASAESKSDSKDSAPASSTSAKGSKQSSAEDTGADVEDVLGDDALEEPAPKVRAKQPSNLQRKTGLSKVNLVLVALLAAAIVIIIQQAGRGPGPATSAMPSGHPNISATAKPSNIKGMDEAIPVDTKREAELKKAIETNSDDLASRQELGVMYIKAALYQQASTVLQEILDRDPNNMNALLSLGLSEFQQNNYDKAEQTWKKASEVKPDAAEPWYNLGFLYMAKTPPDQAQAQTCWDKVIQLAPNSEMAANVKGHQGHMAGGGQTAAPTPTSGG